MRRLACIFNIIMGWLRGARRSRPEDIPKKLPPDVLEMAMREARFLHSQHAVDVQSLKTGEMPKLPKPADGSVIP